MSFPDITNEISASLRDVSDQILNVFKGSAKASAALFAGPTIPFPLNEQNRREQAGLAFGVLRLTHMLREFPIASAPVAATIAFAPALLHTRKHSLYNVGLNPEKVLARGEWHRVVTSQLVNATAGQLLDNAGDLFESGSWLEMRWGWQGLLGAVAAISSLAPSLYCALTAFAHRVAPSSALAQQYYTSYIVSPSMIALGITVLCGYDKDVWASGRSAGGGGDGNDQVWSYRYNWCPRLLMTTFLAPRATAMVNTSSMEANVCGIVAGLVCAYVFGAANRGWAKRGGLGIMDVTIQATLLGFLGVASYVSDRIVNAG